METKPVLRLLHHLGRSGGTIISRCLGAMRGTVLLSEINPRGMARINPLNQAHFWHGLLTESDQQRLRTSDIGFVGAIRLINARCEARGERLLIRDWTHLDYIGVPFTRPTFELRCARALAEDFALVQTTTVRHPLDQYLSSLRQGSLKGLEARAFMLGYRRFAEVAAELGFVRYEDFCDDQERALRTLCRRLSLPFDETYRTRFAGYDKVTGDDVAAGSTAIQRPQAEPDEAASAALRATPDYRAALDLLGYRDAPGSTAEGTKRST